MLQNFLTFSPKYLLISLILLPDTQYYLRKFVSFSNFPLFSFNSPPLPITQFYLKFGKILLIYWDCPINFEPECVVWHSAIWRTCRVHICVKWFDLSVWMTYEILLVFSLCKVWIIDLCHNFQRKKVIHLYFYFDLFQNSDLYLGYISAWYKQWCWCWIHSPKFLTYYTVMHCELTFDYL